MLPSRDPIFVARDTYRRRRLTDALRLLPAIGLFLFLAPLVGGAGYPRSTALSGIFVFGAWFGLIVATFALVRLLARSPEQGQGPGGEAFEPDPGPPAPPRAGSDRAPPGT